MLSSIAAQMYNGVLRMHMLTINRSNSLEK